jgi:hypothetical protein
VAGLCTDPSLLRRESSRLDSSISGRVSPRFRSSGVSVRVRASPSAGIWDQQPVAFGAVDRLRRSPGREHVPTAGETEHPSVDAYTQCCARCPQFYRRASPAALA